MQNWIDALQGNIHLNNVGHAWLLGGLVVLLSFIVMVVLSNRADKELEKDKKARRDQPSDQTKVAVGMFHIAYRAFIALLIVWMFTGLFAMWYHQQLYAKAVLAAPSHVATVGGYSDGDRLVLVDEKAYTVQPAHEAQSLGDMLGFLIESNRAPVQACVTLMDGRVLVRLRPVEACHGNNSP